MGGTTAKICLIENYEPNSARVFEVDRAARFLKGSGLPVRIPVIEMVEIGAGGGSIAQVDALKRVTVGPESAGSEPGPACYGRGGHAADRDRCRCGARHDRSGGVRGRHDRAQSGSVAAPRSRRRSAIRSGCRRRPRPTRCTRWCARTWRAPRACMRSSAARSSSEHTLIAFGGAAPLHAARVAEKLGLARVLVPPNAGVGSAVGFLVAPISYELVQSRHMRLDDFDFAGASALLAEMSTRCARAGRAGRARRAGHRAARSPTCAMSGRATRSRCRCRCAI